MKKIIFTVSLCLIFVSCKCKKETTLSSPTTAVINNSSTSIQKTDCPIDGTCTTEIFRNTSLEVKTDDTGAIYYNKIDNQETSVIVYKYNRNTPEDVQDANYSEEIIFEIKNSDEFLQLKDSDLQQTKMLFGRFCFCRGAAGNFKIDKGNLKLTQTQNEIKFELEFKTTRVPQIISAISETIK